MLSYMRIRSHSTGSEYPHEVYRVMKPQILNLWIAVKHHFKNRRNDDGVGAKNWIAELKRIDKGSGYSTALRDVRQASKI